MKEPIKIRMKRNREAALPIFRTDRDKNESYGLVMRLLNKISELDIVEEQWESMKRAAQSLRIALVHVMCSG